MTSFKRTQRKYVQKAYRVRNWREYETGLRARGSLTVWLELTDGKLANWNSPRPTRRKPGRQRKYSNHAIETTVTLGLVFGLGIGSEGRRQAYASDAAAGRHAHLQRVCRTRVEELEGFIDGLFGDEDAIDLPERATEALHHLGEITAMIRGVLALMERESAPPASDQDVVRMLGEVRELSRIAEKELHALVLSCTRVRRQVLATIERPIASAKADAAYDTGDVYKTLENHRAHRSPKVLIPPRKGAQLALDSAGTRQRNRNIRARSRVCTKAVSRPREGFSRSIEPASSLA